MRMLPFALALIVVSCSGGDSPSAPSPTTVQVGGVWSYAATLTGASGGECVGALFQPVIGTRTTGTIQLQQSNATLTATSTADGDGSSCTYTGTAGSNSLALNTTFCSVAIITGIRCANGAIRNVSLLTGGVNATVSGSSLTGTQAETYNVTSSTGAAVGVLTLNSSFTGTRR